MPDEKVVSNAESAVSDLSEFSKPFSNYSEVARESIKALIGEWSEEERLTKIRRDLRSVAVNKDDEKTAGTMDQDEVWIPIRLIDSNIRKEQAKHAAYLTKSPRTAILSCNEDASVDTTPIEKDFTQRARYTGWELPLLKWVDGVETHAFDFVEVVFDEKKPGHFAIEHIQHCDLIFARDARDIQAEDFIVRRIEYTNQDLIKLVRNAGFDASEVAKILNTETKNTQFAEKSTNPHLNRFRKQKIEKVFFKHEDGFVYVAWACSEYCEKWIREPRKLFLGKVEKQQDTDEFVQLFETSYPIDIDVYSISEDECLVHLQGRVDLDKDKAEGATSLMSSACTMMRRAAQMYWTPADGMNDGTEWDEAQSDIKVAPNRVFKKGLKQFKIDPPPAGIFGAIFQIIGQSQQEAGDVNYAVQSNKSTRKTAAEIELAEKDNAMLSSVQVTLRSIALRNLYTRCFEIYHSRVKSGLIIVPAPVFDLLVKYSFTLKPAGDVDVIERQQKIARMMSAWPVYAQSPARLVFLKKLTELLFPDEASLFIEALDEGEITVKLLTALLAVLQGMIQDGLNGEPYVATRVEELQGLLMQGQMALKQLATTNAGPAPAVGNITTLDQPTQPPTNEIEATQQEQQVV